MKKQRRTGIETRRKILEYLDDHSVATMSEIAKHLHLTPATIRYHVRVLEVAGKITRLLSLGNATKIARADTSQDALTALSIENATLKLHVVELQRAVGALRYQIAELQAEREPRAKYPPVEFRPPALQASDPASDRAVWAKAVRR